MQLELGLFLTVDSVCRIDALMKYYFLLIDFAVFINLMLACVIVCGCIMPGFGLLLMVDSVFVAACCRSLDFF